MNILVDPLAMANLGRWKRVHCKSQVRNGCFAKLLLVSDRRDRKVSRMLLEQRKRRNFSFLGVGFTIDAIAA
jgi:hypothetical protein